MKKLFIILAVMAIIIGCAEQHPPQFVQVWKKINKPEEARVILAKVNTNALTESGKAEYGLLKTIVAYKMHRKLENDSLISASIDYYNRLLLMPSRISRWQSTSRRRMMTKN